MRGTDHQTSQMFSYLSPEMMVPQDHPLRVIRPLANAALDRLSPAFSKMYSAIGRPSIPPEQLLRALLLQAFFTVRSERQLMEQLRLTSFSLAGTASPSSTRRLVCVMTRSIKGR